MSDPATTTEKTVVSAAPAPSPSHVIDAVAAASGVTAQDVAAVAGQGLRPNTVSTIGIRFEGALMAAGAQMDHAVARADHVVNGSTPVTEGLLSLASEKLQTRPGQPGIINRDDGVYIPGAAERLAAMGQAATNAAHAARADAGWQNAMNRVNQMQASGDVCHQTSGKVSGASYVVTSCVGGLSAPQGGSKQVSVNVGVSF